MLRDGRLDTMARDLCAVDGVVGVVLGGSRARGDAHAGSDVDLGVYVRGPRDVGALTALATAWSSAHALHAHAGRWVTNEKGLVPAVAGLAVAPQDFGPRAAAALGGLGTGASALTAAIDAVDTLVRETRQLLA